MRRKPSSQGTGGGGYNNQQRKPRFQHGGGGGGDNRHGGGQQHGGHNRPRKNYAASREKYLSQARDALASGDRVLAENYYQHADHCYRMMAEEGYFQRNNNNTQPQQGAEQGNEQHGNEHQGNEQQHSEQGEEHNRQSANGEHSDEQPDHVGSQLPAFLTAAYDQPLQGKPVDPANIQNWEERDA